ncbi:MAG: ABC transporter substrate-binding protein [Anaerolineae bacterium]|nr:ABC transporter substrate-binding protein [Anaerolineae bacterium]
MKERTITRREFIRLSVLTAAGAVAAACVQAPPAPAPTPVPEATKAPPPTPVPAATEAPAAKYKEAPMLAELVKAGKLPPVDERLPKNPLVMEGAEGIGNYGGTWRRCFSGVSDYWGPTKLHDRAWAWFDRNLNLRPRLLESWSVSPDGKVWTIKMREGVKWSDGKAEYNTDDLAFWYEYELLNKKLTPTPGTQWRDPDMTVVKFEAVDKHTARFTYGKPKPLFMYGMTRGGTGGGATIAPLPVAPSHYMKEFHEDTTSDKAKLEEDVKARGFADWQTYYMQFARQWTANPERPLVSAWRALGPLSTEMFVMERNPYFFAVDQEGNQLPYIDKITHRLFENQEVKNLWVTNGEIDMQYRHMTIADLALYKSGEAQGDYKVLLGIMASHVAMQLNLSTKNPLLNEFFNQRNVRIAISHAINRDQVNQLVYNGLLKPRQYSPLPMSPQYYEKAATAHLEYDPDLANRLLDEAGYTQKDAEGIRLHKDGVTPISFIVEGTDQAGTPTEDAALLVAKDLAKVGIKMTYKYVERALYTEHYSANDIEAAWWGGDRTVLPLVPEAIIFRGVQPDRPWCPGWGFWYTDPTNPNAVKPPDGHWIWTIWKIWDEEIAVEPDPDKQTAAFKKILDIWAEELPMIGILGEQPGVIIVKNGFKGPQAGMPLDDTTGDEQFLQAETYYWDDPAKHTV